jgi:hypothetical protein
MTEDDNAHEYRVILTILTAAIGIADELRLAAGHKENYATWKEVVAAASMVANEVMEYGE